MRITRKLSIAFFLLILPAYFLTAQSSIIANRIDHSLIIDGKLENDWFLADSVFRFTQLEPSMGSPSSRRTVVRIMHDDENMYVSFKSYIKKGGEISARIQRRDQLDTSDDIVGVLIDTYNDNRSALLFQVNPLGTVTDAKINDDGRKTDYLWDTEWEVKTSVSSNFWIAEIKIPYSSIQYKSGSDEWGCNFMRSIRANNEIAWWSSVNQNYRVSQNGVLKNVGALKQRNHKLMLYPYATGRYANTNNPLVKSGLKADAGGDIVYKYSSNIKANVTINPDFATVEGDKEQINLTPWELKFPEKRLFFQDGNEMFDTRIQTFYSRRIGDIQYGGKVMGKVGKYQFNGLHAKTIGDNQLNINDAKFNAFRVKRDFLSSSTVGMIYADKVTDTVSYRSYNFDYVLNLGKTLKFTGQYVASTPGNLKDHSGWFMRFANENNIYHYHVRFTSLGTRFQDNVNQTGFVPDDDRLEIDSDINYKFWFEGAVNYLYLSGKNNIFWSQQGELRSWYLTYGPRIYLNNRFSFDAKYNDEYKLLDKDYFNHFYQFILGYNTDEASNAELSYRFGRNFDRDFNLLEFNTRFNVWKKVTVNYEFKRLAFSPDPASESTYLNVLGLDYYFTNDLWIRLFAQNNSSDNAYYFYGLFGWRFKPPFGALYFIVNTDNFVDFDSEQNYYSEIAFIKLTLPISIFGN